MVAKVKFKEGLLTVKAEGFKLRVRQEYLVEFSILYGGGSRRIALTYAGDPTLENNVLNFYLKNGEDERVLWEAFKRR